MSAGKLPRFWRALETIPGLAAVPAEWRSLLGAEHAATKAFFRPNGKLADSYPCPRPGGCGCTHAVIVHSSDDIVAVCRCEPRRCETTGLTREDIVVYEVDSVALCRAVAAALQIDFEEAPVDGPFMPRRLGVYSPFAGFRFQVFLTIQVELDDFERIVEGLVAKNDAPFILLAPTDNMYGQVCEDLLKKRKACFLPLWDMLAWDGQGSFSVEPSIEDILAEFRSSVLPDPSVGSTAVFFPTPPDAHWEDVSIRFVDGHTVSIKAKEAKGVYNYTQMGMASRRNGNPTVQWDLLQIIVDELGILDWSSRKADRKIQKRRELLARNLRHFFRIEGDPFRLTDDRRGWRTRFYILPD